MKKIFIVDDEQDILEFFKELFIEEYDIINKGYIKNEFHNKIINQYPKYGLTLINKFKYRDNSLLLFSVNQQ